MSAPGINNQPVSAKAEVHPAECPPDNKLPENSQENLDARLDHAIEETFPTSDPVSVHITKGPEPERPDQSAESAVPGHQQRQPDQGSAEGALDQVREALNDVSAQASGAAREAYSRGERYIRHTRERYPEAERSLRASRQAVTHRVTESPFLALFLVGAAGYALAWLIHGAKRDRQPDLPDHARTVRGYAPHLR